MDNPEHQAEHILKECRNLITAIDEQIVNLLHQRAKISQAVGGYKRAVGNFPVLQPKREEELMHHLLSIEGTLPKEHLRSIYTVILASSRELQSAPSEAPKQ